MDHPSLPHASRVACRSGCAGGAAITGQALSSATGGRSGGWRCLLLAHGWARERYDHCRILSGVTIIATGDEAWRPQGVPSRRRVLVRRVRQAAADRRRTLSAGTCPHGARACPVPGERVRPPASLTRSTERIMALPQPGTPEVRARSRRQYAGRGPEIKMAWHTTTGETHAYRESHHDPWGH